MSFKAVSCLGTCFFSVGISPQGVGEEQIPDGESQRLESQQGMGLLRFLIHLNEKRHQFLLPLLLLSQFQPGEGRRVPERGNVRLFHRRSGTEQQRMQQDAEKIAFPVFIGKAVVELSAANHEAFAGLKRQNFPVDVVLHLPREHHDKFQVLMPVADEGVIGVVGEQASADVGRKSGEVVVDLLGVVRPQNGGILINGLLFSEHFFS